jgi:hypothetical protein
MYKSGVGCFMYDKCPAIDLICAIRSTKENKDTYHPLLASVKYHKTFGPQKIGESMSDMEIFLEEERSLAPKDSPTAAALCLLVLIGPNGVSAEEDFGNDDLNGFPDKDIYRVVLVPRNDPFGVFRSIQSSTETQDMSEIYASHPFAYGGKFKAKDRAKVVLRSTPKNCPLEFVQGLFTAVLKMGRS